MDINVKVKFESPELMATLLAFTEVLSQMKLGTVLSANERQSVALEDAVIKTESKNEESVTEEVKTISLEEVRAKLASLSRTGKQKEVKALIKKFGANKLTEVAVENYETLLKEAEEI